MKGLEKENKEKELNRILKRNSPRIGTWINVIQIQSGIIEVLVKYLFPQLFH